MFGGGSFGKNANISDFGGSEIRSDFDDSNAPAKDFNFKFRDTISELYDDNEKNAVFRSSMKKGGAMHDFNSKMIMGMSFNQYGSPKREDSPQPPKAPAQAAGKKAAFVFDKKDHPMPEKAAVFRSDIPSDFDGLK